MRIVRLAFPQDIHDFPGQGCKADQRRDAAPAQAEVDICHGIKMGLADLFLRGKFANSVPCPVYCAHKAGIG